MNFFILAKKIRALIISIAISLMVNSSSIFSTLILCLAILLRKKISEHPDIPATTHLGPSNLCINSSESLTNRYEIDKEDTKPTVAYVICTRPSYSPRTLVTQ